MLTKALGWQGGMHEWQGGVHGWQGGCVVGRGHAWLVGGCVPGGIHGFPGGMHAWGVCMVKGVCMAKGGMHGEWGGMHGKGGHAW